MNERKSVNQRADDLERELEVLHEKFANCKMALHDYRAAVSAAISRSIRATAMAAFHAAVRSERGRAQRLAEEMRRDILKDVGTGLIPECLDFKIDGVKELAFRIERG